MNTRNKKNIRLYRDWEIEQLKEKTEKQQEEIERLKNVITKKQQVS